MKQKSKFASIATRRSTSTANNEGAFKHAGKRATMSENVYSSWLHIYTCTCTCTWTEKKIKSATNYGLVSLLPMCFTNPNSM